MNYKYCIVLFWLFSQCIDENRGEQFESFYSKFHSDSLFQLDRIAFPLPGISTDDMDVDDTTQYYWKKEDWVIHRNIESNLFEVELTKSDTLVVERLSSEAYPGWILERRFCLVNGEWFLIYYENINL